MQKRKLFAVLTAFCIVVQVNAQQLPVTAGGNATGTGGSVSFSVGQLAYEYLAASPSNYSITQGVQQPYTEDIMWIGAVSSDWNDGNNWSKGSVPLVVEDVVVTQYPSNQPHVTVPASSPLVTGDIALRVGASLTVDAGKALTVNGDLINEGAVLVKADATGIGSLITNGAVAGSGSFNMEQYLDGSGGATPDGLFWYVGSPVVGAPASSYDLASGNRLWRADETTQSYPGVTNGTTTLNQGQGYVARMGATGTITQTGTGYNTGTVNITGLTRTGATEINRGYNLLSNPYPSTVSWDAATRSDLEPTVWYRTHQGTQMLYDTYNATSSVGTNNNGGGAVTGEIAPTQAFWVQVPTDGLTGSVSFDNSMRSHGLLAGIYRMASIEGLVRMTLSNEMTSDETIIQFNSDAQNVFEGYDSRKFWAGAVVPQLYTTTGTDSLVINGLESVATNPVVDLGVKLPTAGDYTFDATEITLTEDVWLEDRLLNIFQDLNLDATYDFTDNAGNIPTRFALHFGMSITDIPSTDQFAAHVFASGNEVNITLSEPIDGTAAVYDMAGKLIATERFASDRIKFPVNSANGIYIVQIQSDNGISAHKIYLQ
jgi:hypothetical protein